MSAAEVYNGLKKIETKVSILPIHETHVGTLAPVPASLKYE